MRATCGLLLVCVCLAASGCDPTSAGAFVQGRTINPCIESLSPCPRQSASCKLDGTRYAESQFPGAFAFVVDAPAFARIQVRVYPEDPIDSGIDTRVYWYEPGCTDFYEAQEPGERLLSETDDYGYFAREEQVYREGEHLIEIISDLQSHVLIAVQVTEIGL
jgi:hypothetical protein